MSKVTCGIEKLKKLTILDANGDWDYDELPSKEDMMNKINEIINYLDKQVNRSLR